METIRVNIPEGQCGDWKVERFEIPKHSIEGFRCAMHGRPVIPGHYTRLMRHGNIIMSDTPAEISDLSPLFYSVNRLAAERVLLNGLGLGVALIGVLRCKTVRHVDVVESSKDVVEMIWNHMPHPKRRTIHVADAFDVKWRNEKWDVIWHDIWDNVPNEDDKESITRLKRKYARRCKWQRAWCEHWAYR